MFSDLILKETLREAFQFVCDKEKGGFLHPDKLSEGRTGMINETVSSVLQGKYPRKKVPSFALLETYKETLIFIPVDIMEEAVKLVRRKLSGDYGPGGTDSEAL